MTGPRATTTVTRSSETSVAGPTPAAGAAGATTGGTNQANEHFVLTRRRARQLIAQAKIQGVKVDKHILDKAKLTPSEHGEDTRAAPDSAPRSDDVTLLSSTRALERERSEQQQVHDEPHPLAAKGTQQQQKEQEQSTRAGSRGAHENAPKEGKGKKAR